MGYVAGSLRNINGRWGQQSSRFSHTDFSLFLMKALKEMFTLEPPPPWFDILQGNQLDSTRRPELSNRVSPKAGKSSRLNPKRVGAAWAERRKLELELEKRGEPLTNTFSANWLPKNLVEFGNPGLERILEKNSRWRINCPTRKMFSQRITCHYSLTSAKKW